MNVHCERLAQSGVLQVPLLLGLAGVGVLVAEDVDKTAVPGSLVCSRNSPCHHDPVECIPVALPAARVAGVDLVKGSASWALWVNPLFRGERGRFPS